MKSIVFTPQGYNDLQKRKEELLEKRKETIKSLQRAREMGDLSENGLYKAAKFELGQIDRRIRQLDHLLKDGKVATTPQKGIVDVGSKVVLKDNKNEIEYEIVGSFESDPIEGKLSHVSPLGKSLIGKKVGDVVLFISPRGKKNCKVIKVS